MSPGLRHSSCQESVVFAKWILSKYQLNTDASGCLVHVQWIRTTADPTQVVWRWDQGNFTLFPQRVEGIWLISYIKGDQGLGLQLAPTKVAWELEVRKLLEAFWASMYCQAHCGPLYFVIVLRITLKALLVLWIAFQWPPWALDQAL